LPKFNMDKTMDELKYSVILIDNSELSVGFDDFKAENSDDTQNMVF